MNILSIPILFLLTWILYSFVVMGSLGIVINVCDIRNRLQLSLLSVCPQKIGRFKVDLAILRKK